MRISLKAIAEKAGVSRMTVSRALRDAGHVSSQEQKRICQIAEKMGYEPNPVFSRMAAQRFGNRRKTVDSSLTYLRWHVPWSSSGDKDRIDNGVLAGAHDLGYRVESIDLRKRGTVDGLDRELRARGVRGLVFGTLDTQAPQLDFSWEHYTVVKAHIPLAPLPPFAMVRTNPADTLMFALGKLLERGYRRIGIVLIEHPGLFSEDIMRAGVIEAMRPALKERKISLKTMSLKLAGDGGSMPFEAHAKELENWMKTVNPEVVLGFNNYIYSLLKDGCGYRLPKDCAYCSLHAEESNSETGGLTAPQFTEGFAAVHLLDMLLRMDQRGIPPAPIIQQPPPRWADHPLLPRRRKPGKAIQQMLDECFPQLKWGEHNR